MQDASEQAQRNPPRPALGGSEVPQNRPIADNGVWRGGSRSSSCILSGGYALLCRDRLSRAGPEGWFVSTPGVSCFDDKVSPLQKAEIVKIVRSGSYRSLNSQHSQPVPSGRPLSSLSPFFLSLFLLSLFPRRLSLLKSRKLPSSKRSFLAPTRTLLS